MADEFKTLELIEQSIKDVVNGWIRKQQKLLPSTDNPYYIIPELVIFKQSQLFGTDLTINGIFRSVSIAFRFQNAT